jgi:hypothetical protein
MVILHKTALLAAAIALSGCVSISGGPHADPTSGGPMAGGQDQHMHDPMAGGQGHQMHGPMMMMSPLVGCHGGHGDVEARLSEMHSTLHITPAQESAWAAYAEAYRAHSAHMGGMMAMMGAGHEAGAMPPLRERLRHHDEMMSRHLASFQALRAAIDGLYATLDAEQRRQADALQCNRPS